MSISTKLRAAIQSYATLQNGYYNEGDVTGREVTAARQAAYDLATEQNVEVPEGCGEDITSLLNG